MFRNPLYRVVRVDRMGGGRVEIVERHIVTGRVRQVTAEVHTDE